VKDHKPDMAACDGFGPQAKPRVFNEASLRFDISRHWGEYGAHIEVFDMLVAERDRLLAELNELNNQGEGARCQTCGHQEAHHFLLLEGRRCCAAGCTCPQWREPQNGRTDTERLEWLSERVKDHKPDMSACDGFGPPALTPEQERQALAVTAVDDETHLEVAKAIDGSPFMVYATAHKASERITALVALLAHHYGPLVERVRYMDAALYRADQEAQRVPLLDGHIDEARRERDALQAEVERLKGEVTGTSERNKELHFYSAQLSSDLADARRRLESASNPRHVVPCDDCGHPVEVPCNLATEPEADDE
jgi:hypothetical protein